MLLLRLSQGISSGCHHANPYKLFRNCHYCGKGALSFCFDLAKVFFQGATIPPLHHFSGIVINVGRGIMLMLRLRQGISSGCHNATPTHNFFFVIVIITRTGITLLLRLIQGISQGATTPPLHHFFRIVIIVGRVPYPLLRIV